MIVNEARLKQMVERIKALSKVHIEESDVKDILAKIFNVIDYFNSLDEYSLRAFDRELKDVIIIDEFKDFITPASVKLDSSNIFCEELLERESVTDPGLTYGEYLDVLLTFRSWFKDDLSSKVTDLSALKKIVSWSEVASKVSFAFKDSSDKKAKAEYFMRSTGVPYVPLEMNNIMARCYRASYYNSSVDEGLEDYLDQWLI